MPINRLKFLFDQRNARKMRLSITGVKYVPLDNELPLDLDSTDTCYSESSNLNTYTETTHTETESTSGISLRSRQIEFTNENKEVYNTIKLIEVAIMADRYNISDRAVAAIVTAALIDYGIISKEDTHLAVDKNKVRRYRTKVRDTKVSNVSFEGLEGLYFDGRSDSTLIYENGTMRTVKEEHISFVQEPYSYFIGHRTVASKDAETVKDCIVDFVDEKEIPERKIKVAGSDGTVANTGWKGGAIRLLEEEWNRPLQWSICTLHMNELHVRALINHLDGGTSGPHTFSGPLGKRLEQCEGLDIVEFEPIAFPFTKGNLDETTLSADQKYLFDICEAIAEGPRNFREQLKSRAIGPISHSRWTTTANRVLRVYVSDRKPSAKLKTIAKYIVTVYAPVMFEIKHKPSIAYGAVHLTQIVKSSRFLPPDALKIVNKSISTNAFFAHPENITLAMLNDTDKCVRRKGWTSIVSARETNVIQESVRYFRVPKINFSCRNYTELIDFENSIDTNPPILLDLPLTRADIDVLSEKPLLEHEFAASINNIPSHTQAVERSVKLVTESAQKVCGETGRDGLIFNTISSRNAMPKFDSKIDFNFDPQNNNQKHFKV